MDANEKNEGEKKTQLSWSQPPTSAVHKMQMPSKQPMASAQKPSAPVAKSNTTFRNLGIAVAVLAIVGIAWLSFANKNSDSALSGTNTGAKNQTGQNALAGTSTGASLADGSLSIPSPQTAGLDVAVTKASVSVPTWVVIYENYNGQPGNVLGAALFTPGRPSGEVDLLRGTMPGQTYFVGEARDDGDHMFSMANDPAVRDANGNPVLVQFQTK